MRSSPSSADARIFSEQIVADFACSGTCRNDQITAVTVNSLLPGPTVTERVRQYMVDFSKQNRIESFEEAVARYFKEHKTTSLIQRFLDTKEVADVAVFLCSGLASGINGAAQHVEGGIVRQL